MGVETRCGACYTDAMPEAPPDPRSGVRTTLTALFVAAHVLAVVLGAAPAPVGSLNRSAWAEPTVARELDTWFGRLSAVGLTEDRATFEDDLYALAGTWVRARRGVLRPFHPYYRYLGTEQSWRMFVAPHKHPSRLQIHVRTGPKADWELIYLQGDPEHAWRAHQLEHTRMRSALFRYSWPAYRRSYQAFARWVGRQVAAERPDAAQVRLQWARQKTPSAQQIRKGKSTPPTIVRPFVVDLSGLRP